MFLSDVVKDVRYRRSSDAAGVTEICITKFTLTCIGVARGCTECTCTPQGKEKKIGA